MKLVGKGRCRRVLSPAIVSVTVCFCAVTAVGERFFSDGIPFSMKGSYYTLDYVSGSAGKTLRGAWLQTVSTEARQRYVAHFEPYAAGRPLEDVKIESNESSARITTAEGVFNICFADPRTIIVRAENAKLSMKVDFFRPAPYQPISEVPVKGGGKAVLANCFKNAAKFLVDARSGKSTVDCRWKGVSAETSAVFISPENGRPIEFTLMDVMPEWDGTLPKKTFEESVAERRAEFRSFLSKVPSVGKQYARTREKAARLLWSSIVAPRGYFIRDMMLMSKNWMNNVWGWDHVFNAVCMAGGDMDIAWDQFICPFDRQKPTGQIPDSVGDGALVYAFTKPPVHGWGFRRMMRNGKIDEKRLREAYAKLALQVEWWLGYRDRDGNGLAEYDHGNDSGWDNSTAFLMLPPTETTELQSYLAVQMDVLSEIAGKLGKKEDALKWRKRAKDICEKAAKILYDKNGSPLIRQVATGKTAGPATLQTRLAVLAGKMLPENVRKKMISDIKNGGYRMGYALATEPKGEWFDHDGYWRGPVWAPEVMIAYDGLRECGEEALAKEIAKEFCDMCVKSGFAENFEPMTGAPLRDPAYTWTASVFLILAHELCVHGEPHGLPDSGCSEQNR